MSQHLGVSGQHGQCNARIVKDAIHHEFSELPCCGLWFVHSAGHSATRWSFVYLDSCVPPNL